MLGFRLWVAAGLTCAIGYTSGCGGSEFSGGEGATAGTGGAHSGGRGGSAGTSTSSGGSGDDTGGDPGAAGSSGSTGTGGVTSSGGHGAVDSGGDGGSATEPGVGGSITVGDCPNLPGPELVEVYSANADMYCMDATEVTSGHYQAFLNMNPAMNGQPAQCSWNLSFTPTSNWPPLVDVMNHPVTFVDWCDAWAYCDWAGKRLCGQIGGGPQAVNDLADPAKSQWYNACSAQGESAYPYGSVYDAATCNGEEYPSLNTVLPVASAANCQGGFPGLYDLSGNVWEWTDACTGENGANDTCLARGGAYDSLSALLACDYSQSFYRNGSSISEGYVGFRCCAF